MKNKWFTINEKEKTFKSKRKARAEAEAWDKTLWKWGLGSEGYGKGNLMFTATCGLCNLFHDYWSCAHECPLHENNYGSKTHDVSCTPFKNNPGLQYLWLLFVREATK